MWVRGGGGRVGGWLRWAKRPSRLPPLRRRQSCCGGGPLASIRAPPTHPPTHTHTPHHHHHHHHPATPSHPSYGYNNLAKTVPKTVTAGRELPLNQLCDLLR